MHVYYTQSGQSGAANAEPGGLAALVALAAAAIAGEAHLLDEPHLVADVVPGLAARALHEHRAAIPGHRVHAPRRATACGASTGFIAHAPFKVWQQAQDTRLVLQRAAMHSNNASPAKRGMRTALVAAEGHLARAPRHPQLRASHTAASAL